MENRHTMEELRQWQALPLEVKIKMSATRIRGWVNEYGEDGCYISFSGGKDSTVLMDIVRNVCGYKRIPAVFINTGLEYPAVRKFAESQENVETIRPEQTFREVLLKYGYPIIGKEVAGCVEDSKKYLDKVKQLNDNPNRQTDRQTDSIKGAYAIADLLSIERRDKKNAKQYQELMKGIIPEPARWKILHGTLPHKENGTLTNEYSVMYDKSRYLFLLFSPFLISDRCCKVMKKAPAHKYQKEQDRNPIIGTMAEESRLRAKHWIMDGCNAFNAKLPTSKPLSFWTEQDVLHYIDKYKIRIAETYGEVVRDWEKEGKMPGQLDLLPEQPIYKTTKAKRTGCIFCMFGITHDQERFMRLAEEEPQLCDYVMRGGEFENGLWRPTNDGLGYWFVIEWLNVHGGYNIKIPNREKYMKLQTEETREHLKPIEQVGE